MEVEGCSLAEPAGAEDELRAREGSSAHCG